MAPGGGAGEIVLVVLVALVVGGVVGVVGVRRMWGFVVGVRHVQGFVVRVRRMRGFVVRVRHVWMRGAAPGRCLRPCLAGRLGAGAGTGDRGDGDRVVRGREVVQDAGQGRAVRARSDAPEIGRAHV